jgi:serine/threonine protein kinase
MTDYIGQTVGQYRIEALLGTGGMGQVFRGVHKLLDRPAAIKVMQANFAARPDFRARFLQEAKAAAALRHPNIVEIYDYGDENGMLFLVMELMNDGALSALIRRSGGQLLPLPLVLDLCSQVAEGLAAAHAMQVVHRDIKPANLLLRRMQGTPPGREKYTVKINDFGLARLMEGGVETATGAPMGTLAYMSPEQCMGTRQIDGRSDLYSLGVVIYELATGYQPFQINGVTDALYKHVNVPPPRPREMRPDLPPVLEEIILRCLAKKPEDRYATGTTLAVALQGVLGNTDPTVASATRAQGVTRTTFEPLGQTAAAPAPPTVSTLPGYSDVPRVRVVDQSGHTLQVVDVKPQGITVGRQDGNDIVLRSQSVSRQHLRISWDGKQVMVQDLGSSNGTVLGDTRLMPQVSQVWGERQMIRLGSFWLRLEGPGALQTRIEPPAARMSSGGYSATTVPGSGPTYVSSGPPSLVNERIGLSVTPKTLSITPGQPANVQITLTNLGSTVDWFTPTVEGVPPEWVQGAGQEVQLNPGMQEMANLVITVARQPANRAREYPVIIRARSREVPQEYSQTNGVWTVQAFKEEAMRLEPRRASGRGKASYNVSLYNGGNTASRYQLSGEDDEQALEYQFRFNPVDLDAGQEARVPLLVRGRRRFIGQQQRMPFQLHAGQVGSPPGQTAPGEFVNKALLPTWIVPAFMAFVLVAGGVLGLVSGLIPRPGSAAVGTPTPNTGATLTALVQNGANSATVSAVGSQATATAQANASATAQGGNGATATTQANATATAQANVPPPTASTINAVATGLGGPIGEQYVASQDSLYFVEYSGKLSVLRNVSSGSPSYQVLGSGYSELEDLYVASDGDTVYLTERGGTLDRVSLSAGANRSQATIIASGLAAPQQLAVDEANNIAYVAEFNDGGPTGDVVRVNLSNGSVTPVLTNLQHPIGVLLSSDGQSLYVTEQLSNGSTHLSRYSLATGNGTLLATGSGGPYFFLSWANSSKTALLVTERSSVNDVWYLDLTQASPSLHLVATTGANPSDVVVASHNGFFPMLVCVAGPGEIDQLT